MTYYIISTYVVSVLVVLSFIFIRKKQDGFITVAQVLRYLIVALVPIANTMITLGFIVLVIMDSKIVKKVLNYEIR